MDMPGVAVNGVFLQGCPEEELELFSYIVLGPRSVE